MSHVNSAIKMLLILAVGVVVTTTAQAQDQTRFVLKLDDGLIDSFKKYGSLRSQIPENFQNKINFIELQHSASKDNAPVESPTTTSVAGNTASISLDDAMLDSVKKQPVRIKVDGQAFTQIMLNYSGDPATTTGGGPDMKPGFAPSEMFFIQLSNNKKISGEIDGFDNFKLKTAFGDVSVPQEMIAGIRFHTDGADSCVVVLTNGDSLTGTPVVEAITVKTDWGEAEVDPRFIEALTTAQNSVFQQSNTPFGSRWMLTGGSQSRGAAPIAPPNR